MNYIFTLRSQGSTNLLDWNRCTMLTFFKRNKQPYIRRWLPAQNQRPQKDHQTIAMSIIYNKLIPIACDLQSG